jgi:hypothetical protein
MRVRLTRKLADCLDGVDLSHFSVGDVLDLPRREANLLIVEGWALPSEGADQAQPCTPTDEELRCLREQLESWSEQQNRRRAEDRIREELRDSRAVIVRAAQKS